MVLIIEESGWKGKGKISVVIIFSCFNQLRAMQTHRNKIDTCAYPGLLIRKKDGSKADKVNLAGIILQTFCIVIPFADKTIQYRLNGGNRYGVFK